MSTGARRPLPAVASRATFSGIGAATAAMVAWGFSGVLVALTSQPGLVVALERMALAIPLAIALLVGCRTRLGLEALWRSLPGGVLLCGDIAMFYSAVKLTSVADASVIGALQPALIMVLARPLFGERFGVVHILWTGVAIAGVIAVVLFGPASGGADHVLGDVLAIGSTCCWTGYWLVSKHVRTPRQRGDGRDGRRAKRELGSVEYTAAVMLIAAGAMVPVTLLSGEPLSAGTTADWLWMGILAVIPGSAHLVLNWAHRVVSVSVSSVIVSISPVVAAGAADLILRQPINGAQVVGGMLAIVAAAMIARRSGRLENEAV